MALSHLTVKQKGPTRMSRSRRYWLMKSEPGCFSIDDLKNSPGQTTPWDGVRNYQARNLMRDEMRIGDGVLFYHSNIKEPAIVGIAEITSEAYADHTALDPRNDHFDPKATEDQPIWAMVDVRYVCHLPQPITRNDLKNHPSLSAMAVLKRGNRLSVQEVSSDHWLTLLHLADLQDPLTP